MARRTKPTPASQASVDSLTAKLDELCAKTDRFAGQEGLDRLSAKFDRFALDVERRLANGATKEDLAAVHAKLDHHTAALDRATGLLHDNSNSHLVFGAMFHDHRKTLESHDRRLSALETRLPPAAP